MLGPVVHRRVEDGADPVVLPHAGEPWADPVFAGAHPNNDLRRGGTYLEVQRQVGDGWVRVADDGDWSTTFRWAPS